MRQELERLLDTHRAQRPEMQPQDYYKLLYQREFGCGHTAPAPETAGRHLMEEYTRAAGLPGADAVPEHVKGAALPGCVEDIGNGLCRIYLNGAWSREVLRLLGRVFCRHGTHRPCGGRPGLCAPQAARPYTTAQRTGSNMRPTTAWCAGVMQTPGPLCCWPSAFWNPFPPAAMRCWPSTGAAAAEKARWPRIWRRCSGVRSFTWTTFFCRPTL